MALRYADVNTRLVYSATSGTVGQEDKIATFWLDVDGTEPVDIGLYTESTPSTPGASTGSNQLIVQADSLWPAMWDLDGTQDHVYVQVGTVTSPGDLYRIYCDADQRLDAHDTRLTDLEEATEDLTDLDARYTKKTANVRYVSDYIPSGTDTASNDCYTYIMQAVTAAGVGGKIVGTGRYRCDTEVQLLNYQVVSGLIDWLGTGSGLQTTCFDFRQVSANAGEGNTKVGFRNAASNRFEDLMINGPGYSVANSRAVSGLSGSTTSPRFKNVSFYNWEHGTHLENAFYSDFIDCSWQACAVQIYANLCYNVNLYKPRMKCTDGTNYGTGIQVVGFVRGLKIFGGSIEEYATGIAGTSNSDISAFGTYWESSTYTGGTGIDVHSTLGASVALFGCTVYLTKHSYWVNAASSTRLSLVGSGNKFVYPDQGLTPALTTPFAYNLTLSSGDVDLSGDNWVDVYYNGTNQPSGYTSNLWTSGAVANMDVKFPLGDQSSRDAFNYIGRNVLLPPTKYLSAGGLRVSEAANGKQGVATLVGGTVTVANTSITATSRIMLTCQSLGTVTTPKSRDVTARVVGTSFTITSEDATDTSVIAYQIYEPA